MILKYKNMQNNYLIAPLLIFNLKTWHIPHKNAKQAEV